MEAGRDPSEGLFYFIGLIVIGLLAMGFWNHAHLLPQLDFQNVFRIWSVSFLIQRDQLPAGIMLLKYVPSLSDIDKANLFYTYFFSLFFYNPYSLPIASSLPQISILNSLNNLTEWSNTQSR